LIGSVLAQNNLLEFINEVAQCGTVLGIAASAEDLEIVKLLVPVPGIDPDLCNSAHETLFTLAAQSEHFDVMRAIADSSGDRLTSRSGEFQAALQSTGLFSRQIVRSSAVGRTLCDSQFSIQTTELLQFLMSLAELPPRCLPVTCANLLLIAAQRKNHVHFRAMLDIPSVNLNFSDSAGDTPLICCSESCNLDGATLMLEAKETPAN
jgi:ankyrin repeat protein